jgi:hypothetical protein
VTILFGWGAFKHKYVDLRYRFAEVTGRGNTSYAKIYTDVPLEWIRFSGYQIYEWGGRYFSNASDTVAEVVR